MSLATEPSAVLITPRDELFRAADELLSVLPFPTRPALDAEADLLTERRRRLPDLAPLSCLQARTILATGAIVAVINELFEDAPDGAILSFTTNSVAAFDGGSEPLVLLVDRIVEHIAEIAVLSPDTALMVWACFLHLLKEHYPYQTFFGHRIERTDDGVRLRRTPRTP